MDFTPELKAAARAEMDRYRLGPLYTPPSVRGTLQRPGVIGGANWGGGAFDPVTGLLYVKTNNLPAVVRLKPADHSAANPRAAEVDADFVGDPGGSAEFVPPAPAGSAAGARMATLPLVKPPYGEMVAINLNTGDIAWRVPFGDMASVRNHPALRGVKLPAQLGVAGVGGAVVTRSGLVFAGGSDTAVHALDKATGRELWRADVRRAASTPMTYRARSGRQFVVIATGSGRDASLVAFAVK
jgi:quinoprotein glucose dehydrogenase